MKLKVDLGKKKPQDSGLLVPLFFGGGGAMKRCPIVARIAGSIGILKCSVLDDYFTV